MFPILGLFPILLEAVHFAEHFKKAKTSEDKKQAAVNFVKKEINKVPVLAETQIDDVLIDEGIEHAVGFLNRFKKAKTNG